MTTHHTPSFRLPAEDTDTITLSHIALSDMLTQSFHHGRIDGVRVSSEAIEELLGGEPGDILAAIAPALSYVGISEREVSNV